MSQSALIILAVIFVILLTGLLLPVVRKGKRERDIQKVLKTLGCASYRDVVLVDMLDEQVYLEHIVLLPDKIALISFKRFRGNIFAGENIDYWTQVVGSKSFKFPNPFGELEPAVAALKGAMKGIDVQPYIVFTNNCEFPKGKPESVMTLAQAAVQFGEQRCETLSLSTQQSWEALGNKLKTANK